MEGTRAKVLLAWGVDRLCSRRTLGVPEQGQGFRAGQPSEQTGKEQWNCRTRPGRPCGDQEVLLKLGWFSTGTVSQCSTGAISLGDPSQYLMPVPSRM